MALGRYKTVDEIVNDAARDLGLGTTTSPYASQDKKYQALVGYLKNAGQSLAEDYEWRHLQREAILTKSGGVWTLPTGFTDLGGDVIKLPDDWVGIVERTGWDRTNRWPWGGPIDGELWQAIQSGPWPLVYANFRLDTNQLRFLPTPLGDRTLAMEYRSRAWVNPAGSGLNGGQTLGPSGADEPGAGGDFVLFDRRLIVAALKLFWKREKGFDTSTAEEEVTHAFNTVYDKQTTPPTVNLDRSVRGPQLLTTYNVPFIIPH